MLGAITGDIIGSTFQFRNRRTKEFGALFGPSSKFTDDTVCTLAIAEALTEGTDPVAALQAWGRRNWDNGGWGQRFVLWLTDDDPQPYGSYGKARRCGSGRPGCGPNRSRKRSLCPTTSPASLMTTPKA